MIMSTPAKWAKLANCPSNSHTAAMFVVNETEILNVPNAKFDNINKLSIYNTKDNCWRKLGWRRIMNNSKCLSHTATFDTNKSILHIFNSDGHIIEINIKTQQIDISNNRSKCRLNTRLLFIDNECHILTHNENNNENTGNIRKLHKIKILEDPKSFRYNSMHYLPSKKSILIMPNNQNKMYLYSLITNLCHELPIYLMDEMWRPISVITRNKQYVFQLNRCNNPRFNILDLKKMHLKRSNIKTPNEIKVTAMSIRSNCIKEQILSFGYFRHCWNSSDFAKIMFLPHYLIKIIDSYFAIEIIHIMHYGEHWSINIDQIMN